MFGLSMYVTRSSSAHRRLCRLLSRSPLALIVMLVGMCLPATAQVAPAITGISPTTVSADGPNFTLTVTGSGFLTNSVVQINGSNRPTVYKSTLQLTATIFASDIVTPGTSQVVVFNPFGAGGGLTSKPVPLTVSRLSSPVLISASPEFMAQAADRVSLTLVGTNFRPGATVVISPPLAALANSNGHTRASDVTLLSVTVVNPGVMTALISISPAAAVGLRAVDVLNLDGTSTAGSALAGSSQPIQVQPSNSLGAPLSVLNIALMHPRDGTVVMQGAELNAEAILAGTGTGTVIGQWVWDGNVIEQFSASIVGGRSTTIQTRQSLPTSWLGAHTLQLRMAQPNQVASRPIEVVVNPGKWKLEQLIQPAYGAAFTSDDPPHLLWAPVPGAMKYQVGFSSQPYFSTIHTWFDVVDNHWEMPTGIWKSLPEGELYWTVRAVDTSGEPRKALPMRSIYHVPEGSLIPTRAVPALTPDGDTLLEWMPAEKNGFYFVTISSDLAGKHVLRRYLTADPKLNLRAIDRQLIPGVAYFWKVDAIGSDGRVMMPGPVQNFVAQAAPHAELSHPAQLILLASLGIPESLPAATDFAAWIAGQTPVPESNTNQLQPTISASFPQPVNAAEISMMVDEVDITSQAQVAATSVSFTPPLALASGDHTVSLTVGSETATWKFTVVPAAPASPSVPAGAAIQPGTDAEAPSTASGVMPTPDAITTPDTVAQASANRTGPSEDGQIGMNTQWASGSSPPDSNVLSVAEHMTYHQGPWQVDVNGSGLLNSILNPEVQRTSRGKVNDYVLQLGYKQGHWGANLRFGLVSPVLYTDAQFVTAAAARLGVELTFTTPAGTFGGFTNMNDAAPGGGYGVNIPQQIIGASWQAPLPQWAQFRLMWLSGEDIAVPNSAGDVYGSLLNIHLTQKWLWSSEYAISHDNPDTSNSTSKRAFGRAWRSGVSGQPGKTDVNVSYRDVSENFGNPTNPGLTPDSQPNVRGVDSAITQTTGAGTFGLKYTFLANNVHPTTSDELLLNTVDESWSKPFGVKTNLALDARQSLTTTGTVPAALVGMLPSVTGAQDMRDISGNINLSRQVGTTTLSVGGIRDWNRNTLFPLSSNITSSLNVGTNLVTHGFFQLNAQASVNWVAANRLTIGTTRNVTVNLQPTLVWKKPSMQVSPLVTLAQGQTILSSGTFTSDTLTGQYGGRISWILPGAMKFSTLSAQGSYNQNRNHVTGLDQPATQLLVLWTAIWGHNHTFSR